MKKFQRLLGIGLAVAVLGAPVAGWAQGGGGSDTPRPPGSDPSSRVDQLQGLAPTSPGTPGNPTGRASDQPTNPPAANAGPARPAPSGTAMPGSQNPTGRTGGSAPSN